MNMKAVITGILIVFLSAGCSPVSSPPHATSSSNTEIKELQARAESLESENKQLKEELEAMAITSLLDGGSPPLGNMPIYECRPSTKFLISASGGNEYPTGTSYTVLNLESQTVSRCDAQGCDTFDVVVSESGLFTNVQPVEPKGFILKMGVDGQYFELASIGMDIVNYFGQCHSSL